MTDDAERKMQFLYALRSKGVTDRRVLHAMEQIDRGPFVRGIFAERAYEDMPLPIACGQTISQPSVVGLMTQALSLSPRAKVLEVRELGKLEALERDPAIRQPSSAVWPAASTRWTGTAASYGRRPRFSRNWACPTSRP